MEETINIVNNEQSQQFQVIVNREMAFLEYRWHKEALTLMHTYVPESLEGKGIASALSKFALEYAKEKNVKVIVYCPFVSMYLKRHPEYNDLVLIP